MEHVPVVTICALPVTIVQILVSLEVKVTLKPVASVDADKL